MLGDGLCTDGREDGRAEGMDRLMEGAWICGRLGADRPADARAPPPRPPRPPWANPSDEMMNVNNIRSTELANIRNLDTGISVIFNAFKRSVGLIGFRVTRLRG